MAKKVTRKMVLMEREPKGDLQVFIFRIAERILDMTEQKYQLSGLKKDLLPLIHSEVVHHIPHMKLSESVCSLGRKLGGFPNEAA